VTLSIDEWRKKRNITSTEHLITKVLEYIDNRYWYQRSNRIVTALYGEHADLFLQILAATSIRTNVRQNVTNAKKAFSYIVDGIPIEQYPSSFGIADKNIKVQLMKIEKCLPLTGIKICQFYLSLSLVDGAVCVDSWMLKAFNITHRKTPSSADYRHIKTIVTEIAELLNMKTYEVQACLWCYAKSELNGTNFREYKDFTYYL
jgi:hypothetical protein